jgi:hypothetical protein
MGGEASTKEPAAAVGSDQCYRLIYRSRSLLAAPTEAGLADILKSARSKNAELNVTGALMLYEDWFAQVLEGQQTVIEALYARIKADVRHNSVSVKEAGAVPTRLFGKWAMAVVAEHHEPDMPMVATSGGLAQGAPWKVTLEQEVILTCLRDLTRGFGRGS